MGPSVSVGWPAAQQKGLPGAGRRTARPFKLPVVTPPTDPTVFEAAKAAFLEGAAHAEAGRWAEAERAFDASLARLPGRPSSLVNRAIARLALGRPAAALADLDAARAAEPEAPDTQVHRASALAALGRIDEAAAALRTLLAAHPGHGPAWALLGHVERDRGQHGPAREAFERAAAAGHATETVRFALAALASLSGAGTAPAQPPRAYVQALFDGYADDFEPHLIDTLRYRAHRAVAEAAAGRRWASALDLGCGTGLAGEALRPAVARLCGVDLAPTMVERARARRTAAGTPVYDAVACAELVEHLGTTPERHELVVAADVFIYVGALDAVFAGVRRVLAPGGRFAFTVEAADDDGAAFELRPSLRYAHGRQALARVAAAAGFAEPPRWTPVALREEQRRPVAGWCGVIDG